MVKTDYKDCGGRCDDQKRRGPSARVSMRGKYVCTLMMNADLIRLRRPYGSNFINVRKGGFKLRRAR